MIQYYGIFFGLLCVIIASGCVQKSTTLDVTENNSGSVSLTTVDTKVQPKANSGTVFTNNFYNLTFLLPDGIITSSNTYATEPVDAESFVFTVQHGGSYDDNLSLWIEMLPAQEKKSNNIQQIAQELYDLNVKIGDATGSINAVTYNILSGYEFMLTNGFSTEDGGQIVNNGKVFVFIHNDKPMYALMNTIYPGLETILQSVTLSK